MEVQRTPAQSDRRTRHKVVTDPRFNRRFQLSLRRGLHDQSSGRSLSSAPGGSGQDEFRGTTRANPERQ